MKSASPIAWNIVTRLIHWMIATPVLLDFFIEGGEFAHKILGHTALVMVLLRLAWGFFTTDEARFSSLPFSVKKAFQYAKTIFAQKSIHYSGHNPLASWTYVFMWSLVGALGITGFMMGTDRYWGEDWVEELHETLSNGLLALVVLHVIGLMLDSWKFKRKTWLGMFTGKKS
jgi:cytochrome b